MGLIIAASIKKADLDALRSDQLIHGKTGTVYIPISVIIDDKVDKFGQNVSIQLQQSQDDRLAKMPKTFLGNGKVVYVSGIPKTAKELASSSEDDSPF